MPTGSCSAQGCKNKVLCKKVCKNHYMQAYRSNPDVKKKVKASWYSWHSDNSEHYNNTRKIHRNTAEYKQRVNEYRRNYYNSNLDFRLVCCLRTAFKRMMDGSRNTMYEYLGCSLEELKKYLESQWQSGMSWDNYGAWHIDHIIPLAHSVHSPKKAYHYTNLQPLWAVDNIRKGANYANISNS